jgi:hypothetical protein
MNRMPTSYRAGAGRKTPGRANAALNFKPRFVMFASFQRPLAGE